MPEDLETLLTDLDAQDITVLNLHLFALLEPALFLDGNKSVVDVVDYLILNRHGLSAEIDHP